MRAAFVGDHELVALIEAQAPGRAVNLDQRLGERLDRQPRRVAAIDNRSDATDVVEQYRRHVFAADRRIDAARARGDGGDVAKQEARDVEDMDAQILDDETLAFRQIGLAAENIVSRAKGNPAPERRADPAGFDDLAHSLDRT